MDAYRILGKHITTTLIELVKEEAVSAMYEYTQQQVKPINDFIEGKKHKLKLMEERVANPTYLSEIEINRYGAAIIENKQYIKQLEELLLKV